MIKNLAHNPYHVYTKGMQMSASFQLRTSSAMGSFQDINTSPLKVNLMNVKKI